MGDKVVLKKRRMCYSKDDLYAALEEIKHGTKVNSAATKYNIPAATLRSKNNGQRPVDIKPGFKPVFTGAQEQELVKWILCCSENGKPVVKSHLLNSVQNICIRKNLDNPFKNNRPGNGWYKEFMKRHPILAVKVAENYSLRRAKVTKQLLENWFKITGAYLKEKDLLNITPDRIFQFR